MSYIAYKNKRLELINKEIIDKKKDLAKKYKELQKNDLDNDLKDDYTTYFNNELNNKKKQIEILRLLMEVNDNLNLDINNNNNINNDYLKKELIYDQKELMNEIEKINKEIKKME